MKSALSVIFLGIVVIASIAALSYISYKGYEFYAPRYTAVDNKVFHESQAYNDSMIRDLENLQMEYNKADVNGKLALRAIILHRFSIYPEEKLPYDLQQFYNKLRSQ